MGVEKRSNDTAGLRERSNVSVAQLMKWQMTLNKESLSVSLFFFFSPFLSLFKFINVYIRQGPYTFHMGK